MILYKCSRSRQYSFFSFDPFTSHHLPFLLHFNSQKSCVYFLHIPTFLSLFFQDVTILFLLPPPLAIQPMPQPVHAYTANASASNSHHAVPHLIALHVPLLAFHPLETTEYWSLLFNSHPFSLLPVCWWPSFIISWDLSLEFQIHMLNKLLGIANEISKSNCSYLSPSPA